MDGSFKPGQHRWRVGLLWLLLFVITGMGLVSLSPAQASYQPQQLPISLRSVLTADYSAEAAPTPRPPESLSIVIDALRDQQVPATDLPGRFAALVSQLATPVPSVTSAPAAVRPDMTQVTSAGPTNPIQTLAAPTSQPSSPASDTPEATAAATAAPTSTYDATLASGPASTLTPTVTLTKTSPPTPGPIQATTQSLSTTATHTPTRTATASKTLASTNTSGPTSTKTSALVTQTSTATHTFTATRTASATRTATNAPTFTHTPAPTNTATPTAAPATKTATATQTATATPSPTFTPTATHTPTPTASPTAGPANCYAGTPGGLLPSDDTWINKDSATNNYGTSDKISVRADDGADKRGLARFDLSAIPTYSTVNSATLYVFASDKTSNQITYLYRVTTAWAEGSATWNFPWGNPGGDFDTGIAYASFIPDADNCMVTLDLTALVQAWVNGTPNYGLLLYSTGANKNIDYTSKEDNKASERPKLNVVYAAP